MYKQSMAQTNDIYWFCRVVLAKHLLSSYQMHTCYFRDVILRRYALSIFLVRINTPNAFINK